MFEHYGFMDAVCAVKKYLALILVITLVFCAMGFGYASTKNNAIKSDNYVPVKKVDVSVSELFLITSNLSDNPKVDQLKANKEVSLMVASMLTAEHTRQSVFEAVLEDIKADELIASKTSLHDKYANKIVNNEIISEFVNISVLENTSALKINVTSENEKLCEKLMDLYKGKLAEAVELIKTSKVDCSYSSIADTKIGTESEKLVNIPVAGEVSVSKYVIIFAIMGVAISLCLVFAWTLFVPVINRRSDVEGYDTAVIVDKKESLDFALNSIKNKVQDGKVAFVICRGKQDKLKGEEYFKKIKEMASGAGVDMSMCYNVASDYDEFTKACECGRAIVAVSYSNTKHRDYQKTVARLRGNDIQIVGSVVV